MVLPRHSGSFAIELGVFLGGQQFAQINLLAMIVGQLDADGVAAGHDGDACGQRAHRAGDVVGKSDHARRLDAGRRFELVERHHRTGVCIGDFAAHAEILQHGFECLGVLLQHAVAQGEAIGGAWCGQERNRGQRKVAVPLRRRCARRSLARRAGGGLVVLLVFPFNSFVLVEASCRWCQAWRAMFAEVRFAAIELHDPLRYLSADHPAIDRGKGPADPRLCAQQGMHDHAERDVAVLVVLLFVLAVSRRLLFDLFLFLVILIADPGLRSGAARDHEQCRGRRTKDQAKADPLQDAGGTEQRGRQAQQCVTGDTAESGRQWPGTGARKAARESPRRTASPATRPQRARLRDRNGGASASASPRSQWARSA